LALKRSAWAILSAILILAGSLKAADSGIYNPNYKYTGPQSQSIGDDEQEGKDPLLATVLSVLPGVVFHGFGNYYAGDYSFGTRMLTMEILGVGLALWGHNVIHAPENWGPYFGGSTDMAGFWIKAAGVGLIAISWVGDVATAADAAESFNKDHQIQFQLESRLDGVQLSMSHRF